MIQSFCRNIIKIDDQWLIELEKPVGFYGSTFKLKVTFHGYEEFKANALELNDKLYIEVPGRIIELHEFNQGDYVSGVVSFKEFIQLTLPEDLQSSLIENQCTLDSFNDAEARQAILFINEAPNQDIRRERISIVVETCKSKTMTNLSEQNNTAKRYCDLANYISVALLYLKDNPTLDLPLEQKHYKKIVLGHWGCCPGINALYAQINVLIKEHNLSSRLVVGTGHAGPALLANLFIEGSLGRVYPKYKRDKEGLTQLVRDFGTYGGLETEITARYPGMLYAGGEIGGALAFSIGAALNNPKKLFFCILGDGELETALTQGSWQALRLLSKQDGRVLPIINANGYRMGSRSLFSLQSKEEQSRYFLGLGLTPIHIDNDFEAIKGAFGKAIELLKDLKFPVIVYHSPKGDTGPETVGEISFVDSFNSHKPLLKRPSTDQEEASQVERWLRSYNPEQLFDQDGNILSSILDLLPDDRSRLGYISANTYTMHRNDMPPLNSRRLNHSADAISVGIREVLRRNEFKDVMIFSPDELSSNRCDGLFEETTLRYGVSHDCQPPLAPDGRIVEILSEPLLFTLLQGHCSSGQRGFLITYEAFAPLFDSLVAQYIKYLDIAQMEMWHVHRPSLNIIITSLGWQNSPSHQNPSFADQFIGRGLTTVNVMMPCTPEATYEALERMLKSTNSMNILVVHKYPLPMLKALDLPTQPKPFRILEGKDLSDPDVTLIGIGDLMVEESLAAKKQLGNDLTCRVIVIENPIELEHSSDQRAIFIALLNQSKGVVVSYIGYPKTFKAVFSDYDLKVPYRVLGFADKTKGTTVSERLMENGAGRVNIVSEAKQLLRNR